MIGSHGRLKREWHHLNCVEKVLRVERLRVSRPAQRAIVQGGSEQTRRQGADGRRGGVSLGFGDPNWERRLRAGEEQEDNATDFPHGH